MIYLDPQGNDRTSEVGAYLARKSEDNYRRSMLRRFNAPVSLSPLPDDWTPPEGGAPAQVGVV